MFPKTGMLFFLLKKCVTEKSLFFSGGGRVPYNTKLQIITIIQIASSKEIINETKKEMTDGNALHRK